MGGVEKKTLVLAGAVVGLLITNVYWAAKSRFWKGVTTVAFRDFGNLASYNHVLLQKVAEEAPHILQDEELIDVATSIKFEQTMREEFEGDFRSMAVVFPDDEEEEDIQ